MAIRQFKHAFFLLLSAICSVSITGHQIEAGQFVSNTASASAKQWCWLDGFVRGPSLREVCLFDDAEDGELDEVSIFNAALIASGGDRRIANYEARLDQWSCKLSEQIDGLHDARSKSNRILDFLHNEVFVGGYVENATDLTRTLESGQFNCVSSTIAFLCLAERFDLPVQVFQIPGHIYCKVDDGLEGFIVEPTCHSGRFDLNDGKKRNFAVREIGAVPLVALIYYNRGVEQLDAGMPGRATAATLTAFRLDPANKTIHDNLLVAINNWAIQLARSNDYRESVRLLVNAQETQPEFSYFQHNDIYIHQRWAEHLWQRGQFDRALDILHRAHQRRPNVHFFDVGRFESLRRMAKREIAENGVEAALDLVERAEKRFSDRSELNQIAISVLNDRGIEFVVRGDYESAAALYDRALAWQPAEPVFAANRRSVLIRWAMSRQKK